MQTREIQICGIRGIPACHGGFETFAERLALYLVRQGWGVTVYCQADGSKSGQRREWNKIHLVDVPVRGMSPLSTIFFDLKTVMLSVRGTGMVLTLGYNTALFSLLYRLTGKKSVMNMDGIEWKREKWGWVEKAWLYLNERAGAWFANHLIADHPVIAAHLERLAPASKITMIPYGADEVICPHGKVVQDLGLEPEKFALIIARAEPENSILEIVQAFSQQPRGIMLAVLGNYRPSENSYHSKVMASAGREVTFLGAIYDATVVTALRCHARLYIHGHSVGGTNPSLVEALGAGLPILARDNEFNRWVAGSAAEYFENEQACARKIDELINDQERLRHMAEASKKRHTERFTWDSVLRDYEELLSQFT